jgi:hypothetical protein
MVSEPAEPHREKYRSSAEQQVTTMRRATGCHIVEGCPVLAAGQTAADAGPRLSKKPGENSMEHP